MAGAGRCPSHLRSPFQWLSLLACTPSLMQQSLHPRDHARCRASIKYKVTAAMDIKGSGFLGDPSAEVALLVLPSTAPPSGPLSVSESVKVKAMGLFSKGKIQVDVCAPTNTVRAGQSLEVAVKVRRQAGALHACTPLTAAAWLHEASQHLPPTCQPQMTMEMRNHVAFSADRTTQRNATQHNTICTPHHTTPACLPSLQVDNSSSQGLKKVCVTLSQKVDMNVFMGPNQEMRALLFEQSYPAGQAITVPLTIPDSASAGPCTGKVGVSTSCCASECHPRCGPCLHCMPVA